MPLTNSPGRQGQGSALLGDELSQGSKELHSRYIGPKVRIHLDALGVDCLHGLEYTTRKELHKSL